MMLYACNQAQIDCVCMWYWNVRIGGSRGPGGHVPPSREFEKIILVSYFLVGVRFLTFVVAKAAYQ